MSQQNAGVLPFGNKYYEFAKVFQNVQFQHKYGLIITEVTASYNFISDIIVDHYCKLDHDCNHDNFIIRLYQSPDHRNIVFDIINRYSEFIPTDANFDTMKFTQFQKHLNTIITNEIFKENYLVHLIIENILFVFNAYNNIYSEKNFQIVSHTYSLDENDLLKNNVELTHNYIIYMMVNIFDIFKKIRI
jgi:hypothetical protein